jgi:nickel/cobalt transporter (NicO) family protein
MTNELLALTGTAAVIGITHTVLGPDHYLPFVALSKACGWSRLRTTAWTVVCGLGHIGSSIVLGMVGIALGTAVGRLEFIEGIRGEVACWFLTAFALVYLIWGIKKAIYGEIHTHTHDSPEGHSHARGDKKTIAAWTLFLVFVFGPCEPLIPILMYPAAGFDWFSVALVATVYGIATLASMLLMVWILGFGAERIKIPSMERYSHAIAGAVLLGCALAIHIGL